jgi:hypothetical protein
MKVLLQIGAVRRLDPLLFREKALLRLLGFTAIQVREGSCRRGKGKSKPFHFTTLAKLLHDITVEESKGLFRRSGELLQKNGFRPEGVFAVDATELRVDPDSQYEQAGKMRYQKNGRTIKKAGYKLVGLRCVDKKAPNLFVSADVFPINHNECNDLLPLLKQAKEQLGEEKIGWVVADRGFLSGQNLWEVKHTYQAQMLIYSKKNMDVTKELRKQYEQAAAYRARRGCWPADVFYEERTDLAVFGVNKLRWFWTYGDTAHQTVYRRQQYKKYPKGYRSHPISGVLILKYKGKRRKPGTEITLLSTRRIDSRCPATKLVALYRRRQRIENLGFRELKQGWQLNKFPGRSFPAVFFHIMITLLMYNLYLCYQSKKGQQKACAGIRDYRVKDFGAPVGAILIADDFFGVYELDQVFTWVGYPPRHLDNPPFQ